MVRFKARFRNVALLGHNYAAFMRVVGLERDGGHKQQRGKRLEMEIAPHLGEGLPK